MMRRRKYPSDDWEVSLLWYLLKFVAGGASIFFLLYVLYRPTVYANPGLSAYAPPPGTPLLPSPASHDTRVVATILDGMPDAATPPVGAQSDDNPSSHVERSHARKRAKAASRKPDPSDIQRRSYGYRDRDNSWQVASRPWF